MAELIMADQLRQQNVLGSMLLVSISPLTSSVHLATDVAPKEGTVAVWWSTFASHFVCERFHCLWREKH